MGIEEIYASYEIEETLVDVPVDKKMMPMKNFYDSRTEAEQGRFATSEPLAAADGDGEIHELYSGLYTERETDTMNSLEDNLKHVEKMLNVISKSP